MQLIAPSLSVKHRLNVNVSPGDRTYRGSSGAFLISAADPTIWQSAHDLADCLRTPRPRVHDGGLPEVALDRLHVVAAGAVASFAADPSVGRCRAERLRRRVSKVTIKRDVAVQAPHDPVAHLNRLASDILARVQFGTSPAVGPQATPSAV